MQTYDETAVAMIALLKYGTGVPFKRLERLQEHLGMPRPATTQWDLMAAAAKLLWPVLEELIRHLHQRHCIAGGRLDHRAVLHWMETCG